MEENSKQLLHKLNKCIYLYKYKNKLEKREDKYKNSIIRLKSGILLQNMKIYNMVNKKNYYIREVKLEIENNLRRLSQYSLNQLEFKDEGNFKKSSGSKNYELIIENLNKEVKTYKDKLEEMNRKKEVDLPDKSIYTSDNETIQIPLREEERQSYITNNSNEITELKKQFDEQKNIINDYEHKLQSKSNTIKLLKRKYKKYKKLKDHSEIDLLKEEMNKKDSQITSEKNKNKSINSEVQKYKIEIEEKNSQIEIINKENENLKKSIKGLKRKNCESESSKTLESLSNKIDEIISISTENKNNMKRNKEERLKIKMKKRIKKLKHLVKKNDRVEYFQQMILLKNEIIKRLTVYANRARRAQFEQRSVSVYDHGEFDQKPNVPRALNTIPQIIDTELMEVRTECEKNLELLHQYTNDKWIDIYDSFKKIKRGKIIIEEPKKKIAVLEKITSILKPNSLQCDLDFRNNLKIFMKKLDRFNNPEVVRLNINLGIANKYVDELIEIKKILEKNQ